MKLEVISAVSVVVIVGGIFALRSVEHQVIPSAPVATKSRPRIPSNDLAFWSSAVVPEPNIDRQRAVVAVEAINLSPVDHPSEVARLFQSGDTRALNFAVTAWFDADPAAARNWLAGQASMDLYQPALIMIAGKIASGGDPVRALEWAAFLKAGPKQEQLYFDIYAIAARSHLFSESEIRTAPLPSARIDELLSGAAGD